MFVVRKATSSKGAGYQKNESFPHKGANCHPVGENVPFGVVLDAPSGQNPGFVRCVLRTSPHGSWDHKLLFAFAHQQFQISANLFAMGGGRKGSGGLLAFSRNWPPPPEGVCRPTGLSLGPSTANFSEFLRPFFCLDYCLWRGGARFCQR